ncbi:MAG: tetratricopeptide repeat protein [Gemmatimonadales bacterium]
MRNRTFDADRKIDLLRAIGWSAPSTTGLSVLLAMFLLQKDQVSGLGALGVIAGGVAAGVVLGFVIAGGVDRSAGAMVGAITAAGNLTPGRSFSYEESLVARGRVDEAREAYQAHLSRDPRDVDAFLALAALYRDHLGAPERAIALYLEARRLALGPAREFAVANCLIDLYRATGQRGREMTELARFAERWDGSEPAARAREALRRMKEGPA